jgi:hypothetical protein
MKGLFRVVFLILAAILCCSLSSVPLQAATSAGVVTAQWNGTSNGVHNWYWYHNTWHSRCMNKADQYGRWGRDRRWDAWCAGNQRYSSQSPDNGWRSEYPWDYGRSGDHPH